MSASVFQRFVATRRSHHRNRDSMVRKRASRRVEQAAMDAENARLVAGVRVAQPTLPAELPVISLGQPTTALVPLTEDRIQRYTQHLKTVISEASSLSAGFVEAADKPRRETIEATETHFAQTPGLRAISDALCTGCEGACCGQGGDTAYITPGTVRAVMDANPHLTEAEILELYLSRLASEVTADACINQGPRGCVLPREVRADICSAYYCDPLSRWHEDIDEPPVAVLAIQRERGRWPADQQGVSGRIVQASVITADGQVRPVPSEVS